MICPYCGAKAELKDATYIYHTKKAQNWGKVWVCKNYPECDSYVGCHEQTTIPKGRLANPRLRCLKSEAHKQFDPLWKSGLMSRTDAYKWLSSMLNIPLDECHIGMFDVKQCQKVIHLCQKQKNPIIQDYRETHYEHRTFTRGYKNKNYRKHKKH